MYPLNPQLFLASYQWLREAKVEALLLGGNLQSECIGGRFVLLYLSEPAQLALWVVVKSMISHTDASWRTQDGLLANMDQWQGERPNVRLCIQVKVSADAAIDLVLLEELRNGIDHILSEAETTLVQSLEALGF